MTVIIGSRGFPTCQQAEVARLNTLSEQLKDLADGWRPSQQDLCNTPIIDGWSLSTRERTCLVGQVVGHPLLGSTMVKTTDLWALAPQLGWARTFSRFYRLGRSAAVASLED